METFDIKAFRRAKKISQNELADYLGVKQGFISQIENGARPIPKEYISKILANSQWVTKEQTEVPAQFKHDEHNVVPVVPIYAMGGSLTGFDASVSMADCEKMISPISEAEMAIGVYGDSMAPEFPSGSRVLIKRIDMDAFIEWGKTYVLATTNGSIVKVVYPSGEDAIECRSINPDYPPFKVRYKDIHAMYRVLMCMALK